jgi:Spy/CpxP family protein refolding chaperone
MSLPAMRSWIILALIFLLGAATGSLLTIGFGSRFAPGPPGPQEMSNHWLMHLTYRLHLTDDQQSKIRPILTDAATRIESAHRDDVARISKIMEDANAQIAGVLQPDQQAELKKMEQEREQMFLHHMHGHGHPGGHDFHGPGQDDHPPEPPPNDTNTPPAPPTS